MNKGHKRFGIALILGLTTVLSGCGESSDELDEKLNKDVNMSFVNALSYMADFHVKKRSIDSGYNGLFDNDRVVSRDVPANRVGSTYHYGYKAINNMVNLGVKDSNNTDKKERIYTTLSNGENLWVIAWESAGERALSVVEKKRNNSPDVFNVRLFANGSYDISVANNKVLTTEKGKVTDYLKVSSCADGLKVADKAIDLCSGNFGASYLLVVDRNGKLVMAEE
ncbi:hypothetical protein [Paraglaciecola sp.]|uniref:hypothetical protein n=1 Tax=Paraglaciecola sp. TaxID=1920173 RepID=UPI0030F4642D